MSGYGFDEDECPHCDGSGLIGGFSGQRAFFKEAQGIPLTVAERKALRTQVRRKMGDVIKPRKVMTLDQRLANYAAYVERKGPKPKSVIKKFTKPEVEAIIAQLFPRGEQKDE